MRRGWFACTLGIALLSIVPSRAQAPVTSDVHIWTLDFLKVKPGMFGKALNLLDIGWVRARVEAKKQGAIASYQRLEEEPTGESEWDIILSTEYPSEAAYKKREEAFGPIIKGFFPNGPPQVGGLTKKDLYDIVSSRVLREYPEHGQAKFLPVKP